MTIDSSSRRIEVHAPRHAPLSDQTVNLFLGALARDTELREQDAQGVVDWSIDRIKGSRRVALDEASRRTALLSGVERVPIELSPRMQELIHLFDHTLPYFGADVAWVRDEKWQGKHAPPRLFLQVVLHDPELKHMYSVLSFTSNLPPGSDLSQLSPVDLDRSAVLYEEFGGNDTGAIYKLTPHPIDEVLYGPGQ